MTLRIEQGKGHKDRYAMLRRCCSSACASGGGWLAQGKMLDGGWLFPGLNPIESLSTRQLNRAVHAAAKARRSTSAFRCTRCAFVCHPPAGAEGRYPRDPGPARAQEARDHGAVYQVATDLLREVISPLESLHPA